MAVDVQERRMNGLESLTERKGQVPLTELINST